MSDGNPRQNTSLRFGLIFNVMFVVVFAITLVSFFALVLIFPFTMTEPLSEPEELALEACDVGLKSGLGAIVGLLTGKFT